MSADDCARCGDPEHSTEFHDAATVGVPTDDDWEYAATPEVAERAEAILAETDDERARRLEAAAMADGTPPTWQIDPPDEDA